MRIAIAQINLRVGDLDGNASRIIHYAARARDELQADVAVFPELAITGYPPEDLLLRPGLYPQVAAARERVCAESGGIDLVLGFPELIAGQIFNACAFIHDGVVSATYYKRILPNYGVFDEKRYFTPGTGVCVVDMHGIPVSLSICEDLWTPEHARDSAAAGARLLLNINASPYHAEKRAERMKLLADRNRESGLAILYLNLVSGQDELIFDGGSMAVNPDGGVAMQAPQFEECLLAVDVAQRNGGLQMQPLQPDAAVLSRAESIYRALVLGVRDYVINNRFNGVVIGLSGGIDSALTLCIAVDALGADQVEALIMPSRYTADMSVEDATLLAEKLGVKTRILSIESVFEAFTGLLAPAFSGLEPDATEENIQARCRGILLMAVSNKTGRMVLATGNKSEMSVGYATLYGDMAGGFAPLKDVFKTTVYELSEWRNRHGGPIPRRIIDRPPSAELRPDQKDEDSLPPYDVLDSILERYVERDLSPESIISEGFEADTVRRVVDLVDRNEYKRRQAAPGIKISRRAFGRDRRYPITSAYREH